MLMFELLFVLYWMLTSAKKQKQNVPVTAKCYLKEIMSSRCLLFICLGLHTDYIIFLHSLVDLVTVTLRVSGKSQ